MSEANITCKVTKDTLIRHLVLVLALFGIGLSFFYDALIAYPKSNLAFFSYQAFARAADESKNYSPEEWREHGESHPLIESINIDNSPYLAPSNLDPAAACYPLPDEIPLKSYPQQLLEQDLILNNWHEAWLSYSQEMQFESKPTHAYDTNDILGQKIAGCSCFLVGILLILILHRKAKGRLSIKGSKLNINGHCLHINDITRIDLRQWGVGHKGIATFHTKGHLVKVDGMSYGGFNPKQGQPAQAFMVAVLAQYKGEIIDYAQQNQ